MPITQAILDYSHKALAKMKAAKTVEEFNEILLDLISVLQRPVATGDGSGVKRLMAKAESDFPGIISREDDLIQGHGRYFLREASRFIRGWICQIRH